jgi:hypothetical protein
MEVKNFSRNSLPTEFFKMIRIDNDTFKEFFVKLCLVGDGKECSSFPAAEKKRIVWSPL